MKKIYTRCIEIANAVKIAEALVEATKKVNNPTCERFMDVILGCDTTIDELPPRVYRYDDSIANIKSFDFIADKVEYTYEASNTRWFATEDEATAYANNGDYNYKTSSYNEDVDKGYIHKGVYKYVADGSDTLNSWLDCRPVEE